MDVPLLIAPDLSTIWSIFVVVLCGDPFRVPRDLCLLRGPVKCFRPYKSIFFGERGNHEVRVIGFGLALFLSIASCRVALSITCRRVALSIGALGG